MPPAGTIPSSFEPPGTSLPVDSTLTRPSDFSNAPNTDTKPESTDLPMNPPLNSEINPPIQPVDDQTANQTLPIPLLSDTAPPSPTSHLAMNTDMSCSTTANSIIMMARGSEALHSALSAHPATLWVEVDDLGMGMCAPGPPTPVMLFNHNFGLGIDPPELILDTLIRRLFICLLAALKTIGAHVSLFVCFLIYNF